MLQYEKAKKNGGFTLWGDYQTLKGLHSFVMDLSERSPVLDTEGLGPAFSYDLRKAYEGLRESQKTQVWNDEITIYGVEQVWTTFIAQVALFRTGLAFIDSSKHQQSQMYLLEGFLEDVITGIFPQNAAHIIFCYKALIGTPEDHIYELLGSRTSYFLSLATKERRECLPEILASMRMMWDSTHEILGPGRMPGILTPQHFVGHSWDTVTDAPL